MNKFTQIPVLGDKVLLTKEYDIYIDHRNLRNGKYYTLSVITRDGVRHLVDGVRDKQNYQLLLDEFARVLHAANSPRSEDDKTEETEETKSKSLT